MEERYCVAILLQTDDVITRVTTECSSTVDQRALEPPPDSKQPPPGSPHDGFAASSAATTIGRRRISSRRWRGSAPIGVRVGAVGAGGESANAALSSPTIPVDGFGVTTPVGESGIRCRVPRPAPRSEQHAPPPSPTNQQPKAGHTSHGLRRGLSNRPRRRRQLTFRLLTCYLWLQRVVFESFSTHL